MTTNDNKGAIGYGSVNSGVSKEGVEYSAGNLQLSSDVWTFSSSNIRSIYTVLWDAPLSLENNNEKYSTNVTTKLFDYNKRIENTLNVKEFDEGEYFQKLYLLIDEYNKNKQKIISSHDAWEDIHKELREQLTHSIWSLNDSINLPSKYKYLVTETRKIVDDIKSSWWTFDVWLNSYLIPWSLSAIWRIKWNNVLKYENVEISFGTWCNFQEWIKIIKRSNNIHSWSVIHFDEWIDKLNKLKIKFKQNSSAAHWVMFEAKEWNQSEFEYVLEVWNNSFLWINAHIWSNVSIWDNTTIWWGSSIGHNVKIWNNVVVWQWVRIEEWVKIEDKCLIVNWAIIKPWYEKIEWEEYIKNKIKYDTKNIWTKNRRNFVIKLSDNKEDQKIQMNKINKDYWSMSEFNEHHVVPENKLFAVINTNLAIIANHFPNVNILQEDTFLSKIPLVVLKEKLPELDDEYLKKELAKPTKLILKAYPKDKEKFITELMPKVIKAIEDKEDITETIKEYLDYPIIEWDKEKIFAWTVYVTWKWKFNEKGRYINYFWRFDEETEDHNVEISEGFYYWVTHHGWKNKKTNEETAAVNCVLHWELDLQGARIWNPFFPSVYHDCKLKNVNQTTWWVTANGSTVSDSDIWFGVNLMPGSKVRRSELWNYVSIWDSTVDYC